MTETTIKTESAPAPRKRGGIANMTPEQRKATLEKAKAAREANKAAGIKTTRKLTPRRAIRLKCEDCMAGSKAEVRRCTTKDCSLWSWRCKNPENMGEEPEQTDGTAVEETGDPDIDALLKDLTGDNSDEDEEEEGEEEENEDD